LEKKNRIITLKMICRQRQSHRLAQKGKIGRMCTATVAVAENLDRDLEQVRKGTIGTEIIQARDTANMKHSSFAANEWETITDKVTVSCKMLGHRHPPL
jgi:hypothetical protein